MRTEGGARLEQRGKRLNKSSIMCVCVCVIERKKCKTYIFSGITLRTTARDRPPRRRSTVPPKPPRNRPLRSHPPTTRASPVRDAQSRPSRAATGSSQRQNWGRQRKKNRAIMNANMRRNENTNRKRNANRLKAVLVGRTETEQISRQGSSRKGGAPTTTTAIPFGAKRVLVLHAAHIAQLSDLDAAVSTRVARSGTTSTRTSTAAATAAHRRSDQRHVHDGRREMLSGARVTQRVLELRGGCVAKDGATKGERGGGGEQGVEGGGLWKGREGAGRGRGREEREMRRQRDKQEKGERMRDGDGGRERWGDKRKEGSRR